MKIQFRPFIDRLFSDWDVDGAPGAAVAVVQGGAVVHKNCYGFADIEKQVRFSSEHLIPVASITKHFTAYCIFLLQERGALSLDDSVTDILDDFHEFDSGISVWHLCTNTSGLRDHITLAMFAGGQLLDGLDRDLVRLLICNQRTLNFLPGEKFIYSNTNYVLLGWIIEKLTGSSLAEAFKELVFDPVGMANTLLVEDSAKGPGTPVSGYVGNQRSGFRRWHWDMHCGGEGGVWSTLDDMIRWERSLSDVGNEGGHFTLQMGEPQRLNDGTISPYAFGLRLGEFMGNQWQGHSGGYDGYRSFRVRFPESDLGIIVLANQTIDPEAAAMEVAGCLLTPNGASSRLAGTYRSEELDTNYYLHVDDGQLLLNCHGPGGTLDDLPLTQIGTDRFALSRAALARWPMEFATVFRFQRKGSGDADQLVVDCEWASNVIFERRP